MIKYPVFLKKQNDLLLQMAIQQGSVPKGCKLDGQLVLLLTQQGDACKGCNLSTRQSCFIFCCQVCNESLSEQKYYEYDGYCPTCYDDRDNY